MAGFELPGWMKEHIALYKSDPEKAHMWDSTAVGGPGPLPTLMLTTVGRRSGRQQALPLIYGTCESGYVIVASKGGAPAHPGWYLNLVAQPEVGVQVGAEQFTATARTATSGERAGLWQEMAELYPPYNDYQKATDREIPVVVLERKG